MKLKIILAIITTYSLCFWSLNQKTFDYVIKNEPHFSGVVVGVYEETGYIVVDLYEGEIFIHGSEEIKDDIIFVPYEYVEFGVGLKEFEINDEVVVYYPEGHSSEKGHFYVTRVYAILPKGYDNNIIYLIN